MKQYTLVTLMLIASFAHAGGAPKHCPTPGKPTNSSPILVAQSSSSAKSRSNSNATAASNSNATGGTSNATGGAATSNSNATGGTGGSADSTNTNTALGGTGGNSSGQTTAIEERMPRQTPPAFAGTVQPTASCKNAINGGASAPIAGLAFGFGKTDEECDLRETAREFYEMGQPEIAVALLCLSRAAKKLPVCQPRFVPVATITVPSDEVIYTRAQVSDIVRKAVEK